jgi:hypothetical protein
MENKANSIFSFFTCTYLTGGGEIKEERDSGYHLPNAKGLIFLKNPNIHSFMDRGSTTSYEGSNTMVNA